MVTSWPGKLWEALRSSPKGAPSQPDESPAGGMTGAQHKPGFSDLQSARHPVSVRERSLGGMTTETVSTLSGKSAGAGGVSGKRAGKRPVIRFFAEAKNFLNFLNIVTLVMV